MASRSDCIQDTNTDFTYCGISAVDVSLILPKVTVQAIWKGVCITYVNSEGLGETDTI